MRLSAGILLVAGLVLAQPGFGDVEAAEAKGTQAAASEAKSADDEVVCKKERIIGSMIPKKTCTTKRELREVREASQAALKEIQSNTPNSRMGEG